MELRHQKIAPYLVLEAPSEVEIGREEGKLDEQLDRWKTAAYIRTANPYR